MTNVLITGMSGLIGGLLRRRLEEAGGYDLSALNRRPVEGVKCLQADISDLDAIRPAFDGVEVVVHMAASLDTNDWESQLSANVIGTYNVLEAARLAGVKRVVLASSGSTIRGFELVEPYSSMVSGQYDGDPADIPKITHEHFRPEAIYGATKVWGEAIGRHFSDAYGLSVLCVRIGVVTAEDRPTDARSAAVYLSNRDVAQILQLCIDAPEDLMFDVFMATSNNKWGYRDLAHARQVLGYEPMDSAEERMAK